MLIKHFLNVYFSIFLVIKIYFFHSWVILYLEIPECLLNISFGRENLVTAAWIYVTPRFCFLFFFKIFIYFFREMGREGEREGEEHQCVVASHMPHTGDLARSPGMCPDWESKQRPSVCSPVLIHWATQCYSSFLMATAELPKMIQVQDTIWYILILWHYFPFILNVIWPRD